jgi:hypothetical protein
VIVVYCYHKQSRFPSTLLGTKLEVTVELSSSSCFKLIIIGMSNKKHFVLADHPIWESPAFVDLMLDSFIEPAEGKGTFVPSAEFLAQVFQFMPTQCASWLTQIGGEQTVQVIVTLTQGLIALVNALPSRSRNEEKFLEFLGDLKNRIAMMQKGSFLLLPGGWSDDTGDHVLLYVLERKGDTFSFGVCNTGGVGVEYHPISAESPYDLKYKMSIVIDDIPAFRVVDSAFWYLLFKMQVCNIVYIYVCSKMLKCCRCGRHRTIVRSFCTRHCFPFLMESLLQ